MPLNSETEIVPLFVPLPSLVMSLLGYPTVPMPCYVFSKMPSASFYQLARTKAKI